MRAARRNDQGTAGSDEARTVVTSEESAHRPCRDGLFDALFARSGMHMALLDRELTVVDANAEFLTLLDRRPRGVLGHPVERLVHPGTRSQVVGRLHQLAGESDGRATTRAVLLRHPDVAFPGRLTAVTADTADTAEAPPRTAPTIVLLVTPDEDGAPDRASEQLTSVDARILEGVAAGVPTSQLAAQLYLSRQGVEYHVGNMLRRFAVPNRAALVSKAYATGLFRVGGWPPKILVGSVR